MFRLAPEGWPFVFASLALAGALTGISAVVGLLSGPEGGLIQEGFLGAAVVSWILSAFCVYFFRNPRRQRRDGNGLVLSPADGRIVDISTVEEPTFFDGPVTRISIFLSIFNVHVQRAPITGRIAVRTYEPGGFAIAWKAKASEDNEQATLGILAGRNRVMVRQIAGLIARRIVTDPEKGDLVPQGSRIGLIRFGSRVDLVIPEDWEVTCQVGDKAKGGLSALARVPREQEGRET